MDRSPQLHKPVNEETFGKPAVEVLNLDVKRDFSQLRKSLAQLQESRYGSSTGGKRLAIDGGLGENSTSRYMERPKKYTALSQSMNKPGSLRLS